LATKCIRLLGIVHGSIVSQQISINGDGLDNIEANKILKCNLLLSLLMGCYLGRRYWQCAHIYLSFRILLFWVFNRNHVYFGTNYKLTFHSLPGSSKINNYRGWSWPAPYHQLSRVSRSKLSISLKYLIYNCIIIPTLMQFFVFL